MISSSSSERKPFDKLWRLLDRKTLLYYILHKMVFQIHPVYKYLFQVWQYFSSVFLKTFIPCCSDSPACPRCTDNLSHSYFGVNLYCYCELRKWLWSFRTKIYCMVSWSLLYIHILERHQIRFRRKLLRIVSHDASQSVRKDIYWMGISFFLSSLAYFIHHWVRTKGKKVRECSIIINFSNQTHSSDSLYNRPSCGWSIFIRTRKTDRNVYGE